MGPWPLDSSSVAPAGGPCRLLIPCSHRETAWAPSLLEKQEGVGPGWSCLSTSWGCSLPTRTTVWGATPPPWGHKASGLHAGVHHPFADFQEEGLLLYFIFQLESILPEWRPWAWWALRDPWMARFGCWCLSGRFWPICGLLGPCPPPVSLLFVMWATPVLCLVAGRTAVGRILS